MRSVVPAGIRKPTGRGINCCQDDNNNDDKTAGKFFVNATREKRHWWEKAKRFTDAFFQEVEFGQSFRCTHILRQLCKYI